MHGSECLKSLSILDCQVTGSHMLDLPLCALNNKYSSLCRLCARARARA